MTQGRVRVRCATALGLLLSLAWAPLAPAQETSPSASPADARQAAALEDQVRSLTAQVGTLQEQVSTLESRLARQQQELSAAQAELAARTARVKELEGELAPGRQAQQDLDAARADLMVARNDLSSAQTQLQAKSKENEALVAAAREAVSKETAAEERLAAAEAARKSLETEAAEARTELMAARNDLGSAETQLQAKSKENEALVAAAREAVAKEEATAAQLAAAEQRESRTTGYRSAFFAALAQALGPNVGTLVDGERFIFPTDVAFDSGKATLTPAARARILAMAPLLKKAAATIPGEVDWVLRIDGHTDRVPVRGGAFASNRDLSVARAVAVTQVLEQAGLPAARLAPTGFGDSRPLDPGNGPESNRRNRRIELQLGGG
jgi:chemotaxis protein MotB